MFMYVFLPLQQCLPFTVLKRRNVSQAISDIPALQQCLPFTVLKLTEPFRMPVAE